MYSQANVRAGKVLRLPIRALPSVIVDTEKVMREYPPEVRLETEQKLARSPKITSDILDDETPRGYASSIVAGKALR